MCRVHVPSLNKYCFWSSWGLNNSLTSYHEVESRSQFSHPQLDHEVSNNGSNDISTTDTRKLKKKFRPGSWINILNFNRISTVKPYLVHATINVYMGLREQKIQSSDLQTNLIGQWSQKMNFPPLKSEVKQKIRRIKKYLGHFMPWRGFHSDLKLSTTYISIKMEPKGRTPPKGMMVYNSMNHFFSGMGRGTAFTRQG